jgi:hypothetical protein
MSNLLFHSTHTANSSAADLQRLRSHVNDLSIPYVEVRFNTRLQEIERRWPMYSLSIAEICENAGSAEAQKVYAMAEKEPT